MWMNRGVWRGQRIISSDLAENAVRQHARADHYRGYGHGWIVLDGRRIGDMPSPFYHGGAHGSLGLAFPAADAIVILTHTQSRAVQDGIVNRIGMLELFDPPGPYSPGLVAVDPADVPEIALTPEQSDRYAGTYRGRAAPAPPPAIEEVHS
jgi:CubicO group peptidase (beta-lactamase class C family)